MTDDEEDGGLPPAIEKLIEKMDPSEKVRAAIRKHLLSQRGLNPDQVRLDTGKVVAIGESGDEG